MPHMLPSMSFLEHLDAHNPTKQQLRDYTDELAAEQILLATHQDLSLLQQLEQMDGQQEEQQQRE